MKNQMMKLSTPILPAAMHGVEDRADTPSVSWGRFLLRATGRILPTCFFLGSVAGSILIFFLVIRSVAEGAVWWSIFALAILLFLLLVCILLSLAFFAVYQYDPDKNSRR